MEVKNCKSCGRLFNYIGGTQYRGLCPACADSLEDIFQEVKKFVEEKPNCTMSDITENFDVTAKQVEKWVREDRLCFADDSPIGIGCEKCGKMIKSGRYCDECRSSLESQMGSLYKAVVKGEPVRKDQSSKMRFLDK